MKRKFLSVALAITCLFAVFSFVGCTDDEEEYRQINSIEQSIVGEWTNDRESRVYTFKVDGTYTASQDIILSSNPQKKEFYQKGDGVDPDLGHYYIIVLYSSDGSERARFALFDSEPDKLAWITPGTVNEINDFDLFRIFHNDI